MTKLVCEICGGSDFSKQDGTYVCAGCGVRYTPSEVLNLLVDFEESDDAAGERHGSDRDHANDMKALLDSAAQAFAMGNYFEAETYSRKALALDANDYQARRMLAKAVIVQVTADDDRLEEAIRLYADAFAVVPDEFRESLQQESAQGVDVALRSRAASLAEKYEKTADPHIAQELGELPRYIADRAVLLEEATGATVVDASLCVQVATLMNNAAVRVWQQRVLPAYQANEHRDKAAMDAFVRDGDAAMTVIMSSIALSPDFDEGRYTSLVSIGRQLVEAHSMRRDGRRWVVDCSLPEGEKARRLSYIAAWEERAGQTAPKREATSPATRGKKTRTSIWKREVTWKVLIALFCFTRFLGKLDNPGLGYANEALLWLLGSVAFMVWWCLEDS